MTAKYPYKGTPLSEDEQVASIEKDFANIMETL